MHGLKILSSSAALLAALALVPVAKSQVAINIGVQPVCSYGYYDYSPYACAPVGFYGPGYFYNGIFLGMGPWSGWGYSHGWADHRFSSGGGGRYYGGGGAAANRGRAGSTTVVVHDNNRGSHGGVNTGGAHAAAVGGSTPHGTPHTAAAHGGAPHAAVAHSGGSHVGGESHGGGGHQ